MSDKHDSNPNEVSIGVIPYEDGKGHHHHIKIDDSYIWIDGGSVMMDHADWPAFKEAMDKALQAFNLINSGK